MNRAPRIALLNDTSNQPHAGCLAVADAHDRMLACMGVRVSVRRYRGELAHLAEMPRGEALRAVLDSPLREELRGVDAVVVNGEGSIHGGGGGADGRVHGGQWLTLLEAAKRLGKPALLVNATLAGTHGRTDILRELDDLCVRDLATARWLSEEGISHRVTPDSIVCADFVPECDGVFAGKIVLTDAHSTRAGAHAQVRERLLEAFGSDVVEVPLEDEERERDWRWLVGRSARARCVVSMRHHGVLMGLMGGAPTVALAASTHKTAGTLELVAPGVSLTPDGADVAEAVREAEGRRELFGDIASRLRGGALALPFARLASMLGVCDSPWMEGPRSVITTREAQACAAGVLRVFGPAACVLVGPADGKVRRALAEQGCVVRGEAGAQQDDVVVVSDAPIEPGIGDRLRRWASPGRGVVLCVRDNGQRSVSEWVRLAADAGLVPHLRWRLAVSEHDELRRGGLRTLAFVPGRGAQGGVLRDAARRSLDAYCAGFVRPRTTAIVCGRDATRRAEAVRALVPALVRPAEQLDQGTGESDACVIELDAGDSASALAGVLRRADRRLLPGGRVVLLIEACGDCGGALAQVAKALGGVERSDGEPVFLAEHACVQGFGDAPGAALGTREFAVDAGGKPTGAMPGGSALAVVLMKDPTGAGKDARAEAIFGQPEGVAGANLTAFARDYDNPWLPASLVIMGYRASGGDVLRLLAERTLRTARPGSADQGAALCVKAYRMLEGDSPTREAVGEIDRMIAAFDATTDATPTAHRWRISNWYVLGRLHQAVGEAARARTAYERCAALDVLVYSPLLATKTIDARYRLGALALAMGERSRAHGHFRAGVEAARAAAKADWVNVVGAAEDPLPFGLRELGEVLDAGARCAAMLWWSGPGERAGEDARAWTRAQNESRSAEQSLAADTLTANRWLADRLEATEQELDVCRRSARGEAQARVRAESLLARVEEVQRAAAELEAGKRWLEEHARAWRSEHEAAERTIGELRAWCEALEAGKAHALAQAESWRSAHGQAEASVAELREWAKVLESTRDGLATRSAELRAALEHERAALVTARTELDASRAELGASRAESEKLSGALVREQERAGLAERALGELHAASLPRIAAWRLRAWWKRRFRK